MKFERGDIGARLLESITRGLYTGNLNCIREYVQNSIDSKAKKIQIYLENGDENLVIKDDANGMTKDELKLALRLGWSAKTDEDIGWRGIGIWSGVSVCKKVVIITKSRGREKFLIEIDCEKLRTEIESNKDVFEVLTSITGEIEIEELGKNESLADTHYTIIRLEKILPQLRRVVFVKEDIKKYLEDTVPTPFSNEFAQGRKIEKWLSEKGVKLPSSEIFFQDEKIFRPPRKSVSTFNIFTQKEFTINGELIAIGWFVTSKNNEVILDNIGGIVFKKKGFTIGDTNLVVKLRNKSYNKWQIGEIHIVSKNIRENSPRDNFESSENLEDFLNEVGTFIDNLGDQNRYQSDNVVTKFIEKAEKMIESGKIEDAEKEIIKANLKLLRTRNFPEDPVLIPMRNQIDEQSNLDKKELELLSQKIKNLKKIEKNEKDDLEMAKERFQRTINGLPTEIQKYGKKFSTQGKLEFNLSITRPLVDLLQKKNRIIFKRIVYSE